MKYQVSFLLKKWYLHMRDNTLFSHIKNSLMLWLQDKSCLSQQKNVLKWNGLIFHGQLEIQNFKNIIFAQSFAVLTCEIFFSSWDILGPFIRGKIGPVLHKMCPKAPGDGFLWVVLASRVAMDTSSLLIAFDPPLTFKAPAPKLIISDEFNSYK